MRGLWAPKGDVLFTSDYHELWRVPSLGALGGCRLPSRYPDIPAMQSEMQSFLSAVRQHRSPGDSLLFDARRSPVRNDPEFETAFIPLSRAVFSGFQRVAILVQSTTGAMQLKRYNEGGASAQHIQPFSDEFAAVAWVRQAQSLFPG